MDTTTEINGHLKSSLLVAGTLAVSLFGMHGLAHADTQQADTEPVQVHNHVPQTSDINADGTYTVQAGDTLSQIAETFDSTVDELKSANGLGSDLIFTGSKISVACGSKQSKY